jgi:hypothetical protein
MQAYASGQGVWPEFETSLGRLPCYELRRTANPADAIAALTALLRELPAEP